MITISKLAARCGLSRTALLYYERIGLLSRAPRTAGNYRAYGAKEVARLEQICIYRNAGLKLADIRALLDRPRHDASSVLKRRLAEINREVERLRGHQRAILRLLQSPATFRRSQMVTKDKLVSIMKAAGLTEQEMNRFHTEFERTAPAEHQEFLEFLHISAEEIRQIRQASGKGTA
jgi:DNA-binding transcriptional MerR regulator